MEGPYREGKPLSGLIEPDRRRRNAIVLVVVSMVAGAAIVTLGRDALDGLTRRDDSPPAPLVMVPGTLTRVTLRGPDGTYTLPSNTTKTVVHVWLQGCQDCMPAFEAMRRLSAEGGLGAGVPVVNVSYGRADPAWASQYGVRDNLVYDEGGRSVVRPLGIDTFTTLVIDESGTVLHRDRPDRPGYVERVREAAGVLRAVDPTPAAPSGPLTASDVESVVAKHRLDVMKRCWNEPAERGTNATSASVTLTVTVGASGRVASVTSTGSDAVVAHCVEEEVRAWQFPARSERSTTIVVPFRFVRE